jgi:hypothetical protein
MAAARANVLLVGSAYWCRHLKALLNAYGSVRCHTIGDVFRWAVAPAKCICLVGVGAPDTGKRLAYHIPAMLLHRLGIVRSRALYWIGSDVMRLRPGDAYVSGCRNIAGSAWLAEEVRGHGYRCEDRLFPVELRSGREVPFPAASRLKVLAYIPDAQHELHGSAELLRLATSMPDVDFRVIGGAGAWCRERPANLHFAGWVSDVSVPIGESHVLLRRTRHDSFSAFVREGIACGRHVIFTYDVPGVTWIRSGDIDALLASLAELRERFRRGELKPGRPPDAILALILDVRSQARALADALG